MRVSVQGLNIPHHVSSTGVITLSAGVATLDPDHARPAYDVLKEADDAHYRAKKHGRNRGESIAPTPHPPTLDLDPVRRFAQEGAV
jgi:PleD family two-component response regulator